MWRWLIRIILGEIIWESSKWQHIQRLKITIVGANWQLFRLERIAKCSYFILSTQNIKFYWFVMKIKTFLLPIWWYNRGLFPLANKYFGVFVLNGLIMHRITDESEIPIPINSKVLQKYILLIWNKSGIRENLTKIQQNVFCKDNYAMNKGKIK